MGRYVVIDNNSNDKVGMLSLLKNFIFGNSRVELYNPDKVYALGEKCFIFTASGNIKVASAIVNEVTGPFDINKWNTMTLTDTIEQGLDDVVVISDIQPKSRLTQVWFTNDEYSVHLIKVPSISDLDPDADAINMFFTGAVQVVDSTDDMPIKLDSGDLVFDSEDITNIHVAGLTHIETDDDIIIDEQEDVIIHADPDANNNRAFLWIDTDLTDDEYEYENLNK